MQHSTKAGPPAHSPRKGAREMVQSYQMLLPAIEALNGYAISKLVKKANVQDQLSADQEFIAATEQITSSALGTPEVKIHINRPLSEIDPLMKTLEKEASLAFLSESGYQTKTAEDNSANTLITFDEIEGSDPSNGKALQELLQQKLKTPSTEDDPLSVSLRRGRKKSTISNIPAALASMSQILRDSVQEMTDHSQETEDLKATIEDLKLANTELTTQVQPTQREEELKREVSLLKLKNQKLKNQIEASADHRELHVGSQSMFSRIGDSVSVIGSAKDSGRGSPPDPHAAATTQSLPGAN